MQQGRILRIGAHWSDSIPFDMMTWEHLLSETPQGANVDKFVSVQTRLSRRIEVGDYVIKKKGITNHVSLRDQKTGQEIKEYT